MPPFLLIALVTWLCVKAILAINEFLDSFSSQTKYNTNLCAQLVVSFLILAIETQSNLQAHMSPWCLWSCTTRICFPSHSFPPPKCSLGSPDYFFMIIIIIIFRSSEFNSKIQFVQAKKANVSITMSPSVLDRKDNKQEKMYELKRSTKWSAYLNIF